MNAEQKQRALHEISNWNNTRLPGIANAPTGDRMATLLQELVDAPEAEPVAWAFEIPVAGGYQTRFSEAEPTNILELNKRPLFAAPPAPSVPDGWRPFLTDVITAAGLLEHGKRDKGLAGRIGKFAFDAMRATPNPPEPPADVAMKIADQQKSRMK